MVIWLKTAIHALNNDYVQMINTVANFNKKIRKWTFKVDILNEVYFNIPNCQIFRKI